MTQTHWAVITDACISSLLGCEFLGAESGSGLSQGLAHSRYLTNATLLRQSAKAPLSPGELKRKAYLGGLFLVVTASLLPGGGGGGGGVL